MAAADPSAATGHRRRAVLAVIALVVIVSAYFALRLFPDGSSGASSASPAPERLPVARNVVLITLDTLRSDRLSCYGSDLVDTPNIDAFAAEGVRFTNAASAVPFTLPAHTSIMTGLYPPGHGVRENVGYVLDDTIPTLAELLEGHGWSTAGFVSAFVLDHIWGIGRGFEHYFDDFDLSQMETPSMSSAQRRGDATVAEAIRWLDERPGDRPFFLWLHLYDPHEPYTPPEPYASQYPGRPYDGEVAFTDSLVGDFLTALVERDLLDDSLAILTADHGEGLGDHGEDFHGFFVYDSTVHTPLIVRLPSGGGAGRVIDLPVSHVDLLPTVLDVLQLSTPETVDGSSLAPLLRGEDAVWDRAAYSESLYPLLHYSWAPLHVIRGGRYKLIDAPTPELYDLTADPREESNLAADRPEVAARLSRRLAELREALEARRPPPQRSAELDQEALARLQALGYVAGQGGVDLSEGEDRPRADPKDKLALHQRMMSAQHLMAVGDLDGAVQRLHAVLGEDEAIVDAFQMLGRIAGQRERFEEAAVHYRHALELDPNHRQSLAGLAATYTALGRPEDALVEYRRLLDVAGPNVGVSLAMADIHFDLGELDQASRDLETVTVAGEQLAAVCNRLGEIRVEQGRDDEAARLFERAIQSSDGFPLPRFNLAVLLEERGDLERAMDLYERATELAPGFYKAQYNLGRIAGRMGDVSRQQQLWEASIQSDPGFVQGHYYLAKLLMDRGGDLARAEQLTRRGLDLDPEHAEGPLGYFLLADILSRTGRAAEARAAAARGREIQAVMKQ